MKSNDVGPLVLAIDDSEDLLEIVTMTLVREGYRVKAELDGEAGLAAVRTERPELVLLDMMMPGMDGLEFLARLRSQGGPAPPVIVMTGFAGYGERAVELGAAAALAKPVDVALLVEAVASMLATGRVTDETVERNRSERQRGLVSMDRARTAFMARLDAAWNAQQRAAFRPLLDWLARYHGFGIGMINLLRGTELFIEVASDGDGGPFEGRHAGRTTSYCDDVLDPGSTLVIADASTHDSKHFRDREEMRTHGWRFYAGTPVVTPSGVVIGTMCLLDHEPRRFESEDMRLLQALAAAVGRCFQALADRIPWAPPVDAALVFDPDLLTVLVEVAIARAVRHRGRVDLALIEVRDEDRSRVAIAASDAVGGVGFVAVRGLAWPLALVVTDAERNRGSGSMQAATAVAARFDHVRVVSVIPWSVEGRTGIVPRSEATRYVDLARRAWRER